QAEDKIEVKVDYIAKLNEVVQADCPNNLNAAPFYEKAFENFIELPSQLSRSELRDWPEELPSGKQLQLQSWVKANNDSFEQIKYGTEKPCYWREYQGSSMWDIALPSLAKARGLAYAFCLRAKLNSKQADFSQAFSDVLVCYQFGAHLRGPKLLVEQLVGISVSAIAVRTGFEILDRTEPAAVLLEDFQKELMSLSADKSHLIDFTAEKFLLYDHIQRIFTDDGKGGGHIPESITEHPEKLSEEQRPIISVISGLLAQLDEQQRQDWEKMERKQTTELTDKLFEYFSDTAGRSPGRLHNEGKDMEKIVIEMTKKNLMLGILVPSFVRVTEMSFRAKTETDALITTIAVFRYKADKDKLPAGLRELVSADYLKELPMDPYSDEPLVYRKKNGDFLLYSLGADFDDDGGAPSNWGQEASGGDQVFWPVERN
ncbi:hypothetical protein ACFL1G_12040, partial [Planctomycetota bacterium]